MPYRLDEVRKNHLVYAVEGEKDAETLRDLGLCATTNAGGCGGRDLWAKPEWKNEFRGKIVVHLGDNDREGREHVIARLRALDGVVAEQGFVDLRGVKESGDVTDWLKDGHTKEELSALVKAAPVLASADIDTLAERWGVRDADKPPRSPGKEPPRREDAEFKHAPGSKNPPEANGMPEPGTLIVRRVSEVEARPVRWLWPLRVPRGKLTLFAGNPGLGKSQLACFLAARVTTGGPWPCDGGHAAGGAQVIILTAEDDVSDTLRPRLEAAGADVTQVHTVDGVIRGYDGKGNRHQRLFSLETDLAALDAKLTEIKKTEQPVELVAIDPISAYLGNIDSHVNAEVRGALGPVKDLAERHDVAIVGVSHMSKAGGTQALLRVMGSLAFIAAARSGYLVAADPEEPARCLFLPLKNNLAPAQLGLAFRTETVSVSSPKGPIETSRVKWEDAQVTATADEVMAQTDPEAASALKDAKDVLKDILGTGPALAKDVQKQAKDLGISPATLRRAKKALRIRVRKELGGKGRWYWEMKDVQDVQGVQTQDDGVKRRKSEHERLEHEHLERLASG